MFIFTPFISEEGGFFKKHPEMTRVTAGCLWLSKIKNSMIMPKKNKTIEKFSFM